LAYSISYRKIIVILVRLFNLPS